MVKRTVFYAQYYMPGMIVAETWTAPLDSIDPKQVPWPDHAYCFQIYERTDVVDGEATFKGEPKAVSKMCYHPSSKVETLDEVKRNPRRTSTLIDNMLANKWNMVVWSRWNNWPQPFNPDKDMVMPA